MMTKKHFKLFAECLSKIEDDSHRDNLIVFISNVLEKSNPKFDFGRFEEYIRRLRTGEDLKGLR